MVKDILIKLISFQFLLIFSLGYSQSNTKAQFERYLSENNLNYVNFNIKSKIENNEHYKVYYLQQELNNIEIYNSISTVVFKEESIANFSNRFTEKKYLKNVDFEVKYSSSDALSNAISTYNLKADSEVVPSLKYFLFKERLELTWNFQLFSLKDNNLYNFFISAIDGKTLHVENMTYNCKSNHFLNDQSHSHTHFMQSAPSLNDGAAYGVIKLPNESPNHGPFETVVNPSDPVASPFGWHDTDGNIGPEYTITRGNNIYAREDDEGDNSQSGTDYSPDGGNSLNFIYDFDISGAPPSYQDLSITNLFYTGNMMHDIWYNYGFDEQSGNFQENNYGNGGQGGDSVIADAQDGSGLNNASFSPTTDGQNPIITMYLWNSQDGEPLSILNGDLEGTYNGIPAAFGDPLPSDNSLTGQLVLVQDMPDINGENDFYDACQNIVNGNEINGKIAVIRRGTCDFSFKTLAAQNAGAIAVIMTNNEPGNPVIMGEGVTTGTTIPSIMVNQSFGEILIAELESGAVINANLTESGGFLDGSFDNGIIAHEYGHGITSRLVGGAQTVSCLNNDETMSEGLSDWIGLMLMLKEEDYAEKPFGYGTYASSQPIDGLGIRNAPYTTDFSVNDYTYGDTNNTSDLSQPHGVGFVFGTMLWDLTWAFIDQYGYDPNLINGSGGNNKIMQLFIDALKVSPCNPGFVEFRDAILLADDLTNNGVHECLIWEVFARRGLGVLADQGNANNRQDQTEDFSIPSSCEEPENQNDIGILSIDSPVTGVLTNDESVSITIRNFGINDITNFEAYYSVNGGDVFSQSITQTIGSTEIIEFSFETNFDFSSPGNYSITCGLNLESDEDLSNNSISINITSQEEINCPDVYNLPIAWRDYFECYDAFTIDNFGEWISYDLDGGTTWGANAMDFENEGYVGTAIIYNQEDAIPSGNSPSEEPLWNTYEGSQGLYFIASGASNTTTPNNDWMISPEFSLNGISNPILSFVAKSLKDDYGLERFRIAVGNSSDYNDFQFINDGDYIEVPINWTNYEFDLSSFQGDNVRIGINYVSDNSFLLQMDSFKIEGSLSINDFPEMVITYSYNSINKELQVNSSEILTNIKIYNTIGQNVLSTEINAFEHYINLNFLSPSIYFVEVESFGKVKTFKLIVN